jgi:predicted nucleic acid-binding protein
MLAKRLLLADAVSEFDYLVLDTCVLIQENKSLGTLHKIPRPQRRIFMLSVYEFYHRADGKMISVATRRERERWLADQAIGALGPHANFQRTFNSLVGKSFTPPVVVDYSLAADCIARRWPLVTSNVKHFNRIDGLLLVAV